MTIEEKIEKVKSHLNEKLKAIFVNEQGQTYLQDVTLKSAVILKDLVLVDFVEYGNYTINVDLVGNLKDNRFAPLIEEALT